MNESEWVALIEECRTSGMCIKSWCEKHGITYGRYRYWVKKLQHKPQQWVQVEVSCETTNCNGITLHCGNETVY